MTDPFLSLLLSKNLVLLSAFIDNGDLVLRVDRKNFKNLMRTLRIDPELDFSYFVYVTAVDWLDARQNRFELVYELMNVSAFRRLRIFVELPEDQPEIESCVDLWLGANFMEREVWDMFGIKFIGHPDLRRILMYPEFVGHPLRKDYPVQGKQPRIKLRYPEVRNTAVDMKRPPLVKINRQSRNRES
ncbi:MAG TPA: NADH-quinone oxidoreductase subunit C [Oligoflexia bacterium]|nr:NADH-quinone oxidoreductase subunit C [Oligoflexia bacterium]HMP27581.1 NADH-quinone oxidoreductase subunit C [Oligoflexia bacterium]